MSRYHGQRHIKGGFEVDEESFDPDANYWAISARGAYNHLVRIVGFETAEKEVEEFWNEKNTWKDICLKTETILEGIEKENKYEESV